MKVLVVEDEETLNKVITKRLKRKLQCGQRL